MPRFARRARESGKSEAIKKATEIKTYNQDPLVLDLHSYGSEDRLIKNLFESSQFRAWGEGIHTLHIFLDSLDECLLRIDNVTALLAEEFKRHQDKVDSLIPPNCLPNGDLAIFF